MPATTQGQAPHENETAHKKVVQNIQRKFERENQFRGELDTVLKSPLPIPKKKRRTTDFFGSTIRIEDDSLTEPMEFRAPPIPSTPYSIKQEIERALDDKPRQYNKQKRRSVSMGSTTSRTEEPLNTNALDGRLFNDNNVMGKKRRLSFNNRKNNKNSIKFQSNNKKKNNTIILLIFFILTVITSITIYMYYDTIYNAVTEFKWEDMTQNVLDMVDSMQNMVLSIKHFNMNEMLQKIGFGNNNSTIGNNDNICTTSECGATTQES